MAIKKTLTLENNFGEQSVITDCYIKVVTVSATKDQVNAGTATVHLGVGPTAAAAQANAVAATAGNPAAGIPLVAGAVEVLRFPLDSYFSGVAGAANTVYITPGEGL